MTKSQRDLTGATEVKITQKVDRKVGKEREENLGKWGPLQGLRNDRNLGPPSRVSTGTRKELTGEQWGGESRS